MTVREAVSAQDYEAFSVLIDEYVSWLRDRYEREEWLVGDVLGMQALQTEMQNLASVYAPPRGRAFIAELNGEVCGCGAYRRLDASVCEMKRVFVPARFQGNGIGRSICNGLLDAARNDGFRAMRLDTGKLMTEAIALYQSVGFAPIEPYLDYPPEILPYFLFMERAL